MSKKIVTSVLAVMLLFGKAYSQQIEDKIEIIFSLNGYAVEPSIEANQQSIQTLDEMAERAESDPLFSISSIEIDSYASPEGDSHYNQKLTARRSQSMRDFLQSKLPIADSLISVSARGVAWDRLRQMVAASNMTHRSEVLNIIDNVPVETWRRINPSDSWSTLVDSRNKHLMDLRGGEPYKYMQRNFFHKLRSSSVVTLYFMRSADDPIIARNIEFRAPEVCPMEIASLMPTAPVAPASPVESTAFAPVAPSEPTPSELTSTAPAPTEEPVAVPAPTAPTSVEEPVETPASEPAIEPTTEPTGVPASVPASVPAAANPADNDEKSIKLALKTNLLYDVLLAPNIELEVPIGNRWSVAGEWICPWWVTSNNGYALQVLSGQVEGRYWFGDRAEVPQLTGWFAGLYAGGGLYDLQWKNNGYQGEFYIAAGLAGGYAHTINKKGNLRMEYSLGLGYLSTEYRYYEGMQNNEYLVWQHDGKYTWLGPTKAKVSLVWFFDWKRGGKR